jgi:hypothetical protein
VVIAGRVTASKPVRSRRRRSHLALRWSGLVWPEVPARGTAQQVANSSREGTTRRRFRPSRRISQPLSEFALLGSMDPASNLPHTAGPNRPRLAVKWGPTEWPMPHSPTHTLTQKQGTGVGKSGGDRDSSWAVVCRTLWPRRRPRPREKLAPLGGRADYAARAPDGGPKPPAAAGSPSTPSRPHRPDRS